MGRAHDKYVICSAISQAMQAVQKNQKSLTELVIAVMGMYPTSSFHLLSILLQENLVRIPLRIRLFPTLSFNQFLTAFKSAPAVKDKTASPSSRFPASTPQLYSQFLSYGPVPTNRDTIDVTPFEFYILRFLKCVRELRVTPQVNGPPQRLHLHAPPPPETTGILAVQLFLHYITYFINPNQPSKPVTGTTTGTPTGTPTGTTTGTPSLQRPDFFLLYSISELWLRMEYSQDDWFFLYHQSSRQTSLVVVCGSSHLQKMIPTKSTMVACLRDLLFHLARADELVRTGSSLHLNAIEPMLFFFFAKQFTYFTAPPTYDTRLASLLLVFSLQLHHV